MFSYCVTCETQGVAVGVVLILSCYGNWWQSVDRPQGLGDGVACYLPRCHGGGSRLLLGTAIHLWSPWVTVVRHES